MKKLAKFFESPKSAAQKQYEAVRAIVVDGLSHKEAAQKYSYSVNTLYSLIRDVKSGKIELFPVSKSKGPKQRRIPDHIRDLILRYREQNISAKDIAKQLQNENYKISKSSIENILKDFNLPRLPRRTNKARGLTQNKQLVPDAASQINFDKLKAFSLDCPVVGVFFFLPYILESGVVDIIKECKLPESSQINSVQACLSMLLLKLIGSERLSHMEAYNHEPGLGLFAGLSILPKSTYMATYSCRTSEEMLMQLQVKIISQFKKVYPDFYKADYINLDFHSIPHFGTESQMERVWCGARGKAMKGVNTILAQDADSNVIIYTNADILRKNEAKEIQSFAQYWKNINGSIHETLVFDCKLTTYTVLDDLASDGIKFITLRKRNKKLLIETHKISENDWQKIRVPIPKRKHKSCSVHESTVNLPKCKNKFRQIIIKNHGRSEPTFIITSNHDLLLKDILLIYAKRWHIENKIAEMVSFFNLNALSSPLMIRIHFDILWTLIADTLYHRFAHDLPRFEQTRANTLFRMFVNMPGKIHYDGKSFTIKIRKRACTPILLSLKTLRNGITVPWLADKKVYFEWTA